MRLRGIVRIVSTTRQRIFSRGGPQPAAQAIEQRHSNAQCTKVNSSNDCHRLFLQLTGKRILSTTEIRSRLLHYIVYSQGTGTSASSKSVSAHDIHSGQAKWR